MEHAQPQRQTNGKTHGSVKIDHSNGHANGRNGHSHSFNPNGYMLKLPKKKKITLGDGQVKWIRVEADYLPVAPRIAWFRLEHPDRSIIAKEVKAAKKAVVMKAVIKNATGRVIATAVFSASQKERVQNLLQQSQQAVREAEQAKEDAQQQAREAQAANARLEEQQQQLQQQNEEFQQLNAQLEEQQQQLEQQREELRQQRENLAKAQEELARRTHEL